VFAFKLYDVDEELSPDIGDEEENSVPYKELLLPSRSLDTLWEKYVLAYARSCGLS
jgi:hypothetical protein